MDPGSDREHIDTMVRNKGYTMPAGMMYVRLVHLLDDQKRKELMIIYGEDLAPTGLTVADLRRAAERTISGQPCRRACSITHRDQD